ncbi:penicillin-binding transpeptidase domain-containing protein [Streptomyces sp. NPDC006487]|uniref:penicillin-binding transpeptidase domain-containing protein n=1 Tax=Streptomyces sp. NPDC006487 TaxID=3364748 RepID=UPI003683FBB1
MNTATRRTAVLLLLMVLALLLRASWVQAYEGRALADNPLNRRASLMRYARPRGDIYAGGRPVTGSRHTGSGTFAYRRTYPDGPLYAPVTGYDSQIYGTTMLENLYRGVLDGTDTRLKSPLDVLTNSPGRPGAVLTTIDPAVQKAGYEALHGASGGAVAIDPSTGAVLALVSSPSYDPGRISGGSGASEAWKQLSADRGRAMANLALREPAAPGSAFKLVTAAAALEDGLYPSVDAPTRSPVPYTLPGTRTSLPNEQASAPCRDASLRTALRYSCNNVFAKAAHDLGQPKMLAMAEKFGFDEPGQDIPVRAATSVYPTSPMAPSSLALTGIGQFDVTATPLQMAMVSAVIDDDGKLAAPYLVSEVTDSGGKALQKTPRTRPEQVISPRTAQELHSAMETVVRMGGGASARVPGAVVGGKTGTAQRGVGNSKNPYAWFTAYADKGGRRVAVAVWVRDSATGRSAISGGRLAAPVAARMMTAALGR